MPLSFSTLLGGTTTLIGTPPNLLIAEVAERLRGERFAMFDFAPVGVAITLAGIVFIVALGWRFLPRDREVARSTAESFDVGRYVTEARLPAKSRLVGKTIRELEDSSGDRAAVLGLMHGDTRLRPSSYYVLEEGDVLLLQAETEALQEFVKTGQIELVAAAPKTPPDLPSAEASVPVPVEGKAANDKQPPRTPRQVLDTMEAVVTPTSWVQGSTARSLRLRARYDANLLALSRCGRPVTTRLRDVPWAPGDVLLLEGPADLPDIVAKYTSP
jgi:di/tricarboxylate transporter